MSDDPSALDVAIELGAAFEAHHIDYAIGGALAYGFWGIPRATVDVDINLFCPEAALAEVVQVTAPLGIALDVEAARSQAEADGLIVVQYRGMRDVRRWIVEMVGEDDARVARWDRLLADRIA